MDVGDSRCILHIDFGKRVARERATPPVATPWGQGGGQGTGGGSAPPRCQRARLQSLADVATI